MAGGFVNVVQSVWARIVQFVVVVLRLFGIRIGPYNPTQCGPTDPTPGCKPNPWPCGSAIEARVFDAAGGLATYEEDCGAGPHIIVRADRGFMGWDAAARAELRFPSAPTVTIRVVHFSNPGKIEAFEPNGALADAKQMAPSPAVEQDFTLNGRAINRVVVTPPSPTDETRVLQFCH
jgi:hypothetical protein